MHTIKSYHPVLSQRKHLVSINFAKLCPHRWRYDDDNAGAACEAEGQLDSDNERGFFFLVEHDSIKS